MQLQFVGDRGKRNLGQKKEIRFPIHESEYPERKTFYSNRASHSQYYRHRTLHVRTKLLPTHIISLRLLLIILVRRRHSIDDNSSMIQYRNILSVQYQIRCGSILVRRHRVSDQKPMGVDKIIANA